MGTELVLTSPEPTAITPVELLRIAITQDADLDKLKQLMDLQERWEKNEAKKAFVQAMNAFKANPPVITKNKTVAYKDVRYSHPSLDHVCDQVTKALSKHGISHRWKTSQSEQVITVTCILTHEAGYSEETTLYGNPDNTGSKNALQAIGSAVTYLERYTLMAACGLAAENGDDDGRSAEALPSDKVAEQCEWLANAKDMGELQRLFSAAYKEVAEVKDKAAMASYIRAKDARKKEL